MFRHPAWADYTHRISPTAAETPQTKVDRRISPSRCISLFQQRSFLPSLSPTAASWHLLDLGGHFSPHSDMQTNNKHATLSSSLSICTLSPSSPLLHAVIDPLPPRVLDGLYRHLEGGRGIAVSWRRTLCCCMSCMSSLILT